eukprot:TRINITY_DN5128_c0_g1_i1.p1 TRINITY_DN5128_c0_g1~~TRINITY_DN5128_c0_g1_i1.p1  ORF type:complete len:235 (-),score=62.73 TRINITY_DN5128_c0_g1_i1:10-693(-)
MSIETFIQQKKAELSAKFTELLPTPDAQTVDGSQYIPILSLAGFQLSAPIWVKLKQMTLMNPDLPDPFSEPFYLDDVLETFDFLDETIRVVYCSVVTSPVERVPDERVNELFKAAGYEVSDDTAKFIILASERAPGEEGVDLNGWISMHLFMRYAVDAFESKLSITDDKPEEDSLPFEAMKEIFEWMKIDIESEEQARALFEETDTDGNGTIDIDEFLIFMTKVKYQ